MFQWNMGLEDLDNSEQKQNKNDQQNKADTATAIVAQTWPESITAKGKYQNQNNQNNEHRYLSVAAKIRSLKAEMQFSFYVQ